MPWVVYATGHKSNALNLSDTRLYGPISAGLFVLSMYIATGGSRSKPLRGFMLWGAAVLGGANLATQFLFINYFNGRGATELEERLMKLVDVNAFQFGWGLYLSIVSALLVVLTPGIPYLFVSKTKAEKVTNAE